MGERIRHASVYFKGRKVATCHQSTFDIASGDETQLGDEGYIGHSDGATMSKVECDTVVPVGGVGVTFIDSLMRKQYVEMGLALIDGKVAKVTMRIVNASFSSDAKSGALTGKFSFEGGVPKFV